MPNREEPRFDLFGCKVLSMVACRQTGERQGERHQVEELAVLSLHIVWLGHRQFSPTSIRGQDMLPLKTKNGPAEKPQARAGEGVEINLNYCPVDAPYTA
jgi:hypothetical protein